MSAEAPLSEVFRIFEDPRNLARITPPWLNFKVLNADSIQMRTGAEIEYIIRWMGLPIKWKTVIDCYDPPHSFVDTQARGPYRHWWHEHTFEETTAGVTINDRVEYELPFGFLGRMAHALMVRRQLLAIFRYRQMAIAKILEGSKVTSTQPTISSF